MSYRPKCPICGGFANSMQLIEGLTTSEHFAYAVECWSGDINREGPHHIFLARVKILGKTEIDYLKVAEAHIGELQRQLAEALDKETGKGDSRACRSLL